MARAYDKSKDNVMADEGPYKAYKHLKTKVTLGDEKFQKVMLKEPPRLFPPVRLILSILVAFCCSTANGYDSSLFGSELANPRFTDYFNVHNAGIGSGIVTAMSQIGSVVAIPFIGPALDTWGRRWGMFIGGMGIMIGVTIQTCTIRNPSVGQFMAGRFLMGWGIGIITTAGPTYVVEVSHPAYRGIYTGLYNVLWPVGSIVASGAARGGYSYHGNTTWLIPVGLQMMFPGIVVLFFWFLPESPRWLYTHGQRAKAAAFLAEHHGSGNPESEWVKLQLVEYEEHLEMNGADRRWWDYRALFGNRASIYRLMANCFVALFGQWAGNGVVTYFLSAFLDIAGIRGSIHQTDIMIGLSGVQFVSAACGACLVDKLGRRPMLIWVNVVCSLCWIGVLVPASMANIHGTAVTDVEGPSSVLPGVSKAILAFVFIFQACYSFGWTPMQALYPVEVLSYEMRAKGMAFQSLFMNVGLLTTQFGIPVALDRIAWRTYIVYCAWCMVQAILFYFFLPETKNRTLEELDIIFHSKNVVQASIAKRQWRIDENENIAGDDEEAH